MAVFQCSMCGGILNVKNNESTVVCEYCGTAQTLKKEQNTVKETVIFNMSANASSLLKRAFMFLEDGDWISADEYCEKVLDLEPENGQAYLGKLMAELHMRNSEELKKCKMPFDMSDNYKKAVRFGVTQLKDYSAQAKNIIDAEKAEKIYSEAKEIMDKALNSHMGMYAYLLKDAISKFESISGYRDADALQIKCKEELDNAIKANTYAKAVNQMHYKTVIGYEYAIKLFSSLNGWKDSEEKITECENELRKLKAERAQRAEENFRVRTSTEDNKSIIILAVIVLAIILTTVFFSNM